ADLSNPVVPLAFFEGFGRDPEDFETTITADGDGWRVRGRKVGVAFTANDVEHVLVIGRDPDVGELRGAFVSVGSEGASLTHEIAPDADKGFIALSQAKFADLDVDT